jgi:hypothetical protein
MPSAPEARGGIFRVNSMKQIEDFLTNFSENY